MTFIPLYIILRTLLIKLLLKMKVWIIMKDMRNQKDTVKFFLLIICLLFYSLTEMYEKYNLVLLIILAGIAGVAIHYVVEFMFYIFLKLKNKGNK